MAALFGNAGAVGDEAPTAEQFNLGFQKMAGNSFLIWNTFHFLAYFFFIEAAQLACQGQGLDATAENPQYVDSITQAIKGLKEGSENLTSAIPPDDVANMFAGLQMNDVNTSFNFFYFY